MTARFSQSFTAGGRIIVGNRLLATLVYTWLCCRFYNLATLLKKQEIGLNKAGNFFIFVFLVGRVKLNFTTKPNLYYFWVTFVSVTSYRFRERKGKGGRKSLQRRWEKQKWLRSKTDWDSSINLKRSLYSQDNDVYL